MPRVSDKWMLWSFMLFFGTLTVIGMIYFAFQDNIVSAIVFGVPTLLAIAGTLWGTHNFFAAAER